MVDTSGHYPPVITAMSSLGGGVYVDNVPDSMTTGSLLQGRISLGLLGVMIVGAVAFYWYTRSIQGGG
jgi:hypothetical protein